MSSSATRIPGVYLQERRARSTRALPTGVPVFIGLLTNDATMPAGTAADADFYGPVPLRHKAEFLGGAAAYLAHAINGFFDNGGEYCYVVGIKADPAQGRPTALRLSDALNLTTSFIDIDLVAVPDAQAFRTADGTVNEALALEVQGDMIHHCARVGTRIAVLDALPDKAAEALIEEHVKALDVSSTELMNAALYHPWIRTIASTQRVPPCGQVCGIIARTDAQTGVFKAPANAKVEDATDLDAHLDGDSLVKLNMAGVNCIRAFRSRGIRIWGARTLSPDPQWRYLNVRRLVLTVLRWIDANMAWAAFEPNVPALWARIQRELETYLTGLWRAGALQGDTVTDAFFVRCDAGLNPSNTREVGQVVTQLGLAAAAPAEFIIVSVQHRAGTTELT